MRGDDCTLLLRLKARARDAEPAVAGQVLESLLAIERRDALPSFANSSPPPIRCPKKRLSPSADRASPKL
jgi:hypothetical protein